MAATRTRKPAAGKGKAPAADVKPVADALSLPDPARQLQVIHDALAALPAARATAAATAALKTETGSPVARAYLTVVATPGDTPIPAADTIAQFCAKLGRSRDAVKSAFVATWRRAADITAVDGACKNLGRAFLDDPELAVASLEAARKLGDAAAVSKRTARLERATRLAPIVDALRGTKAARARAVAKLPDLSEVDRLHVYARVIAAPRDFDASVAVAAVLALAGDARVPDMPLATAVADMRYHGADALVAAWQPLAVTDATLRGRLLTMFEWTALGATDPEQLAPFVHALQAAGGLPDVFAQVENALASDSPVVRAAICDEWLRDEPMQAFTDAQVEKLMAEVIAIAENGNQTLDGLAANRALFHANRAAAYKVLVDGVTRAKTARNEDLRWNLYYGLSHVDHPDVVAFLIERLFVELEEYGALVGALADRLDAAGHRVVLDRLGDRGGDPASVRAAMLYVDVLIDRPRLLVELGRKLLRWAPHSEDDGRRLRFIFEHATAAALAQKIPVDARAFLARARELPAQPYSDYWVKDRGEWTPSPFTDPTTQQRIAALEAGRLVTDGAAEAARAGTRTRMLWCRVRVASFPRWKRVFDAERPAHRGAGLTFLQLARDIDDTNLVFFTFRVESLDRARAFLASPEAAELAKAGGVLEAEYRFVENSRGATVDGG
jgi:hypothetical protein